MKLNEVLVQEEQLNEFYWPPEAMEGLVNLVGPTAAFWISISILTGAITTILGTVTETTPKMIVNQLKNWFTGRTTSKKEIQKIVDEVKSGLTRGQKTHVSKIQNQLINALEEKDFTKAGRLLKELKQSFVMKESKKEQKYKFQVTVYLTGGTTGVVPPFKTTNVIATDDRSAKILAKKQLASKGITNIRSIHIDGSKELIEATPFRKIGNHKGYMGRTLTPAEQAEVKAKLAPKPRKPSKEEKQKELDAKLWKIYMIITDAVSNAVPDGDPIDFIAPKVSKFLGIDRWDVKPWLDKAIKRNDNYKSYDDYLAGMWDGYYEATAESPEEYARMKKENPWR